MSTMQYSGFLVYGLLNMAKCPTISRVLKAYVLPETADFYFTDGDGDGSCC